MSSLLEYGCFSKGTKVLMYDGTEKNIEDIRSRKTIINGNKEEIIEGDKVLGFDSNPIEVIDSFSGKDVMFNIKEKKKKERW